MRTRMKALGVVAVVCVMSSGAAATLVVDGGDWVLQPNQAGQTIDVTVSGSGDLLCATILAEISGPGIEPQLVDGDIITGTIFEINNTGFPAYDFSEPQLGYADVAADTGITGIPVGPSDKLASFTVSTVGVHSGTFDLLLTGTTWGDSMAFTNPSTPVKFIDGTITVTSATGPIPEPATTCALVLAYAGLGGYVRKRRRV